MLGSTLVITHEGDMGTVTDLSISEGNASDFYPSVNVQYTMTLSGTATHTSSNTGAYFMGNYNGKPFAGDVGVDNNTIKDPSANSTWMFDSSETSGSLQVTYSGS